MVPSTTSSAPRGTVVAYAARGRTFANGHERASCAEIARRIARLIGFEFAGDHRHGEGYSAPLYVVPNATLLREEAAGLGIAGEGDLFGGVVPHAFVATKAITHPLVGEAARAPPGWCAEFGRRVQETVLTGFTAFDRGDAHAAGRRLLERGPARLKPVNETAGRGQAVCHDEAELAALLDALDPAHLGEAGGVVLEEDLSDATTFSVGQARIGELVASYYGTQCLTRDNAGLAVYGGSALIVARGDYDALLRLDVPEEARVAIAQARIYDAAAAACFPGMFASRRNYDVIQGTDADGRRRSGVMEQSWRLGGATSAEIAAMEAFRADPALMVLRASSVETYGEGAAPPPGATVYFHGVDEKVGALVKYARVEG